jgi:hypothetical protein
MWYSHQGCKGVKVHDQDGWLLYRYRGTRVLECAGMLTCPFVSHGFLTQRKWLQFYTSFCNLYWIRFLFIFSPLWSWHRASLITFNRYDIGSMISTPENSMGFTCSFILVSRIKLTCNLGEMTDMMRSTCSFLSVLHTTLSSILHVCTVPFWLI